MATRRVIVVDDSAAFCSQLAKAIRTLPDVEAATASDGIEALKQFQDTKFDLIVTDLNMPVMGGLRFITKVKSIPGYHGTPILVISGSASAEEREVALDIGAKAYLAKPLKLSAVIQAVSALLDGRPAGPPKAATPAPVPQLPESASAAPPRRRILVCDDDVVLLRLVSGYLRQQFDADVRVVTNGADALKTLSVFRPDLLILDFMMPKMNGDAVLDQIRDILVPAGLQTRVLVYSAVNVKKEVINKGAADFLQKPARVADIEDAVRRLLAP